MISFQQIRSFFISLSLSVLLAITLAFGLGITDSLAAISSTKGISQDQVQIASTNKSEPKNIGEKVQGIIDNMTGNSQPEPPVNAKELKAKTQEGLNNSIDNPNYQPGGKTDQVETEDRQSAEDMKTEASEFLN